MLTYITKKIRNQKWLSLSLLLGIVLLTAIAACQPSFQNGCQNKLIRRMFDTYIVENNRYPLMIGEKGDIPDLVTISDGNGEDEFHCYKRTTGEMNAYLDERKAEWMAALPEVGTAAEQRIYAFSSVFGDTYYGGMTHSISVQHAPDILNHITLTEGEDYTKAAVKDGAYPCIVSEAAMDHYNLFPGEKICYEDYSDEKRKLVFYIAGVFTESSEDDMYWFMTEKNNPYSIYVSGEIFDAMAVDYDYGSYKYFEYYMPDYTLIQNNSADDLIRLVRRETAYNVRFITNASDMLQNFAAKRLQINVMISVLELPILGMMLAFLFMVSNQIVVTGKGQLATLKSRGFRNGRILKMYLGEYTIITVAAVLLGIPVGYALCILAAGARDFCVFGAADPARYPFRFASVPFALGAGVVALVFVMLPVIKHTRVSIVEHKAAQNLDKKMFWEKAWLDVVFLGLSLYFLYVFNQSSEQLRAKALAGNKMDPFMFLNVCLFILAAGFFIFRLMHGFVKLVYAVRRKKWKPVAYTAFLQIIRSFRKQTFITVFMILTIAFGLFDANLDRTINRNMEERNRYNMGADVHVTEKWYIKSYMKNGQQSYRYLEPDFVKYQKPVQDGIFEKVTRVYSKSGLAASMHGNYAAPIDMIGIETKAFGETTTLDASLYGEEHWYNTLNALSEVKNGVILSDNLAEVLEINVGDAIMFMDVTNYSDMGIMPCIVVGIVSAWPGYEKYYYEGGVQMERSLAITNISSMIQYFELKPYEVWAKKAEGVTDAQAYAALTEADGIDITAFRGLETINANQKNAPEIQILNGIFTLSFLIAILLCAVGFLIYWLISMKQRELLLGSYRAMGLSVASINGMLLLEHLFSTFLSVIGGGVVGMAATYLFIPLFGVVFLPEKSVLTISTYFEGTDIGRLFFVVGTIILLCLLILRRQIKKMNITQALKLGED